MHIEITKRSCSLRGGAWYVGRVGSYRFEALVFAEPSRYGIDAGHVSKLCLLDRPRRQGGRELACYDRGWDLQPESPEARAAVSTVVEHTSRCTREREKAR